MIYIAIYLLVGFIYALVTDKQWRDDTPDDGVGTWQEWAILIVAWPVFVVIQLISNGDGYD